MSLEAILTVITVVLAVVAVIPQERGQDLRLRLGGTAAAVATLAAGLICYWSLMEPLHSLPWFRRLPRVIPWLAGWDPASSSLAVVLLATGYCWWTYGRRIPVSRLPELGTVLRKALARRRFAECTHLLEAHLGSIRDGLEGSYWQSRLRKRLFPSIAELHLAALTAPQPTVTPTPTNNSSSESPDAPELDPQHYSFPALKKPARVIQWFIDWAESPPDAAHDILRLISLSPELVRHIAATHPYLGLSLSQLPSTWLVREFTETFSRALLSDPESILYRELRRAENVDLNNVPVIDRVEQPLLSALCDDSVRHDGPRLLYTYVEAGIDTLRTGADDAAREELNQPIGDYFERMRWSSPPFATVYLLEITGPRNAVSAEAQTLNLYVLSSLVNSLLQQLSPREEVDLTCEWPTPIHYLLYQRVSLLVDLVGIWKDRPSDLPPNKLAEMDEGLPRILPVHAIDVLGRVMYTILRTRKLDARFKGYLLEVWWRAFWEKYKTAWTHSDAVLSGLVRGGHSGAGDLGHRNGLAEALEHVDIMTQISEGGDKLRSAFELPPR